MIDDLDWTPRPSTARVPIFCDLCEKQGTVVWRNDDRRYGSGFSGPTMTLAGFLRGDRRICGKCERKR